MLDSAEEAADASTEESAEAPPTAAGHFSTLKSGVAGGRGPAPLLTAQLQARGVKEGAGIADSRMGFIPAPARPPAQPQPGHARPGSLQMSPDNCRKVNGYAKMFGVSNPQKWVRHNCHFVQSFVRASCQDINSFVDSCFPKA